MHLVAEWKRVVLVFGSCVVGVVGVLSDGGAI